MSNATQSRYFNKVAYRSPTDPVVEAYVHPKLTFIQNSISLEQSSTLDVGCGNGIFTYHLNKLSRTTIGLDYSKHLLDQNTHDRLIRGDALALPFPDNSFDLVFEANLLHHVMNREGVAREMARVSRKHVVFIEPNRYNPLMFAFSLIVSAEHGGLKSSIGLLKRTAQSCGLKCISTLTTGMISQTNTPASLVPYLKRFDRNIWWGEYIVIVAEKL